MWSDEDKKQALETLKKARVEIESTMPGFNQPGASADDREVFYKIGGVMVRLNKAIDTLAWKLYGEESESHN